VRLAVVAELRFPSLPTCTDAVEARRWTRPYILVQIRRYAKIYRPFREVGGSRRTAALPSAEYMQLRAQALDKTRDKTRPPDPPWVEAGPVL
jgi:hypothetical protein